jgi:N-acetylglucosaminyldiphosphoundecaprenol N-acetyl-beta-D-mannosaminyltransferase
MHVTRETNAIVRDNGQQHTVQLLGYGISNAGLEGDIGTAWDAIHRPERLQYMACANPHSLVVAAGDPIFRESLQACDILVPDGTGVLLAGKLLGLPLKEKVAGTDFFLGLTRLAQQTGGLRYFFLGSSDHVLKRIAERLIDEYPAVKLVGMHSPPFRSEFTKEENAAMVDAINNAKPDVLWVGMTAPKQEKWIYINRHRLQVPFAAAIGAVFDFYAGTKKRSSAFWINLGLEWLPRFVKEPRRLWERNLQSTPIFLSWVIRERWTKTKQS